MNVDGSLSVEHLLLAYHSDNMFRQQLFKSRQLSLENLKDAITPVRSNKKKTTYQSPNGKNGVQNPNLNYTALKKYGNDLSQPAKNDKLDPVVGGDDEIRRCIHILSRRTKNNPIIVGEDGVGKSAIVEGLAQQRGRSRTTAK